MALYLKTFRFVFFLTLPLVGVACSNNKGVQNNSPAPEHYASQHTNERIVSLNGAITEIISALGHEKELVGRDVTSNFPQSVVDSVPGLGHVSTISMEAILNLKPTLIVGIQNEPNQELLRTIESSGIRHHFFPRQISAAGTKELIREVGKYLNTENYDSLLQNIDNELDQLEIFHPKPKILFIYARGAGSLMVAGGATPFDEIISLAGGTNAIQDFIGFKPLTPEALVSHNPDVFLFFDTGLQSIGGIEGLLKVPGVIQTNAGKNRAVLAMDGSLLSGFGPRVGEAAHQLNGLLAPYGK